MKASFLMGSKGAGRSWPSLALGRAPVFLVPLVSAVWLFAGGPPHLLALLLSMTSLSLVLLVLQAEKRRNFILNATLDRLSRQIVVKASGQD